MVASVVVSHEAAVGGLSFGLLCKRLVRWRQRSGCARVRDRARAWARAKVVHRTTGTKVQAQEQTWEDRARETKAQAHRGTGAQGQACSRGLKTGPPGFCCHGVRGTRCEIVARCVMFLVPLLASDKHSRTARRTCVQVNTSLLTIMLAHCETCPFFCAGGWWMSTVKVVRKKNSRPRSALVHRAHACEFCSRT